MGSGSRVLLASVFTLAGSGIPQVADGGSPPTHVHYSVLHSFQGAESSPRAPLISDGRGNLYGTTARGGPSDGGTVFTIRTDGTGFRRLHTFMGGVGDGFDPEASLVDDDAGNLYGTTTAGGTADWGTVFTIKEDGSAFEILHSFSGGVSDGGRPYASLTADGAGNLYGTTVLGGTSNGGTIFKLRVDGTAFQLLHTFAGGVGDGRLPQASLLLDDSGTLFGTTAAGGHPPVYYPHEGFFSDGFGTIFRISADGTGFQILRAFPVDANDGAYPSGSVITDEAGYLYGLTGGGGSFYDGTAFRIAKDGSAFQILHSFAASATDAVNPVGSLLLDRSGTLYGMTSGSLTTFEATLFKVRTDATGYQVLRTFVDPPDGTSPSGSLILVGSGVLYGTMADGGFSNSGTVFGVDTDGSGFQVLHAFAGFVSDGCFPLASMVADGSGYLYGTTLIGGSLAEGIVFRMRSDGTGFQILHTFSGGPNDGVLPSTPLILDRAGYLYGTTSGGGPSGHGILFRVRTDGSAFQLLHAFQGGAEDGLGPVGALILDSNNLYGTTANGGPSNAGTVFRVSADGASFRLLHGFTYASANDGAEPRASLALDNSGNLFGTTTQGGALDLGTIFKLRTDGTDFHLLHIFVGGSNDGLDPSSSLINDGSGNLYGTTAGGGASSAGTIFTIKTDGTNFLVLHSFMHVNEGGSGLVILDGLGSLYGTTQYGGPFEAGTVFRIKTDGTGLWILHAFGDEAGDGRYPRASLFLDGSGHLIGTTENGGSANFGTVFVLSINPRITTLGPFVPVRKR